MNIKTDIKSNYLSSQPLIEMAAEALIDKMGVSKASEFWSSLNYGKGNYLKMKREIFSQETINSLYKKLKKFQ